MKKIFLAIAATILSFPTACAGETMWGITGGLNVSSLSGEDYTPKTGFNVGAKMEYAIADPFFAEASLVLSEKGMKSNDKVMNVIINKNPKKEAEVDLWYLHVPVNFGYKFDINSNLAIAPKAGVFVSLGLWGFDNHDNNPFTDYDDVKIKELVADYPDLNLKIDNFNRCDFGFDFGVNLWAAKHFEISTGYDLGMVKAYRQNSNTRNWYLNLAFLF